MNTYYNVEFTDSFGSFVKGEKFPFMTVDYGEGTIQADDHDGPVVNGFGNLKTVKTCRFKATPIDE